MTITGIAADHRPQLKTSVGQAFRVRANGRRGGKETVESVGDFGNVQREVHAAQGKLQPALEAYERARQLRPQDASVPFYIGRALSKLNRSPEAVESFRQAIRLKPDFWEAHFGLGGELGLHDLVGEARTEFEEVIRLKPDHALAHLRLRDSGAGTDGVVIPRAVLERAYWKAQIEYSRATGGQGVISHPDECWSEFQALRGYLKHELMS